MRANVAPSGNAHFAIATHERQPFLTSGDKRPDFAGPVRSSNGIPHGVHAVNGQQALPTDFCDHMASSLLVYGSTATAVTPRSDQVAWRVPEWPQDTPTRRSVLQSLRERKSDTHFDTRLKHDSTLRIFTSSGEPLAQRSFRRDDDLGRTSVPGRFPAQTPGLGLRSQARRGVAVNADVQQHR